MRFYDNKIYNHTIRRRLSCKDLIRIQRAKKWRQLILLIRVVAKVLAECFAKQFDATILFIYANDLSLLTSITCLLMEKTTSDMTPDSISFYLQTRFTRNRQCSSKLKGFRAPCAKQFATLHRKDSPNLPLRIRLDRVARLLLKTPFTSVSFQIFIKCFHQH